MRPGGVSIRDRDWAALAKAVSGGAVLYRSGEDYNKYYPPQNQVYSRFRPAGIVRIKDQATLDVLLAENGPVNTAVKRAIIWARDNMISIAARSGGHSYAGYSATDGLLIDFGGQQTVYPPDGDDAITFGSGMQGKSLYPALKLLYPRADIPTGRCPTVAIGGLALNGGIGFLDRKYGLTCDQMLETTMVTADGVVRVCSDQTEKDLFWAVRGAGHGNFGIHTSFKFQGHPLPGDGDERIGTFFKIEWDIGHAFPLINLVQKITDETKPGFALADKLEVRIGISTYGRDRKEIDEHLKTNIIGIYHGPSDEFKELFKPVLGDKIKPRYTEIRQGPTADFLAEGYAFGTIPTIMYTAKSGVVNERMSEKAVQMIIDCIKKWPGSDHHTEGGAVALFTLGGQINQVEPADTAFFHRNGLFLFNIDASFETDAYKSDVEKWAQDFYVEMRNADHVSEYCYQGFPDPALKNWSKAYYGTNYSRLQEIKRHYDVDNFFHYKQSIVPALRPPV